MQSCISLLFNNTFVWIKGEGDPDFRDDGLACFDLNIWPQHSTTILLVKQTSKLSIILDIRLNL